MPPGMERAVCIVSYVPTAGNSLRWQNTAEHLLGNYSAMLSNAVTQAARPYVGDSLISSGSEHSAVSASPVFMEAAFHGS